MKHFNRRRFHRQERRTISTKTSQQYIEPFIINTAPYIIPINNVPICRLIEKEQESHELFNNLQQECSLLMGFIPILDNETAPKKSQYVPNEERKRQLQSATEKKKKDLMKKWGLNKNEAEEQSFLKHELSRGRILLDSVLSIPGITARGKQLAIKAADTEVAVRTPLRQLNTKSKSAADHPEEEEQQTNEQNEEENKKAAKLKVRAAMIQKEEENKRAEAISKAKKRNDRMEAVRQEKREQTRIKLAAAVPGAQKPRPLTSEAVINGNDDVNKSTHFLNTDDKVVFNFGVADTLLAKPKKSRPTVAELIEKRKELTAMSNRIIQLEAEGKLEELQELKAESMWDAAEKRVDREQVTTLGMVDIQLKRDERKKKNRGKKLVEVMNRQKQDKHKKLLKRSSNLRERRVERLAKKMKRFTKKGHYVPGFM